MQHYESIRRVLGRVRRRWRALHLFRASARAALMASAVIAVALMAAPFTRDAPLALAVIGIAAVLLLAAIGIREGLPLRHSPDDTRVARFIEERAPALDDRLASAVDAVRSERQSGLPAFVEPMLEDAARRIGAVNIDSILSPRSLRRAGFAAAGASGIFLALVVIARGPAAQAVDAATMALFPSHVTLEVTPGNARVNMGTPFAIQARLVGNRAPVTAHVEVAAADAWRATDMPADGGGFRLTIPAVTAAFTYRVIVGVVRSPEYAVTVARAPRVARIDLEYRYPAALGLKPRTEEDGGDIYAPAGTDVRVLVHTDRPVATARMALGDGHNLALASDTPTTFSAAMKVEGDNSYRIALADGDGLSNAGDTEYFIRAIEDQPPEVRIVAPAADKAVTPLEEVDIEARAEDDYGISSLDLVYAVRGGAEQVVSLGPGKPAPTATGRHTLYLEDLRVQPGDFVSYYVRARDIARAHRSKEAKSDIFFLEVRPFDQQFRVAQSQASSGGGSSLDELVNAQKEIVVATWKLDRRAQAANGARSEQDIRSVSRAEAELKTRVEQTASTFRETTMRDPRRRTPRGGSPASPKAGETLPEEDSMTAASRAMGEAVVSLDALKTSASLPPEMEALNHLLKAQAEVREREVSRQQAGSGNGDNNRNLDLSSLFDRELQRQQQTNYETTSSSEQHEDASQSTLDKIKELARRQDELLKRQQDLAGRREQMTEEELKRELEKLTREQSALRQQAEDLSSRMSGRESSGDSQPSSGDRSGTGGQGRQMRDISEQMRRATSDLRRQDSEKARASASQALDKLRELERQLQNNAPDERRRALGEAQLEARQLADAERQAASEIREVRPDERGRDTARRLAGEQERLAERTRQLQESLSRQGAGATRSTDNRDRNARTTAGDASRDLQRQQLAQRMQQSADELRNAAGGAAVNPREQAAVQEAIAKALDNIAEGMQEAGSRDSEQQKLSAQLARTQELRKRMADTSKELGRLGNQGGQPAGASGRQQAPGSAGQRGEGQQAGDSGAGSALARLQDEYQRQLEQTRQLLDELKRDDQTFGKSGAGFTFEGQGRTMSAPGTEAFKQDFAAWEILRQQATAALDQAETTLSKKLQARTSKERLAAGMDDKAPAAYEKQVDSYFKALAAKKKQ